MSRAVKENRRDALIEIIQSKRIYTQSELAEKIREKGFEVTQTTISRDIESLQIIKGPKGYELPSSLSDEPKWIQTIKTHGISIQPSGETLLVLKTQDSAAQMIANEIDLEQIEGIVGTVAGIDTIFIAVKNQHFQTELSQKIQSLF